MRERLIEFLKSENKSSAQFAEEIGVQPSGISHILSGRNNPSLDFVIKMLEKYSFISTDWLLFGTGHMYKESGMKSLFDENPALPGEKNKPELTKRDNDHPVLDFSSANKESPEIKAAHIQSNTEVEKIVWFYSDNSFELYYPGK